MDVITRRALALAAALAATCVVSACGSSSSKSSGGTTPSAGTKTAGAASKCAKRVKVYVILPSLQDEAYIREDNGAKLEVKRVANCATVTITEGVARGNTVSLVPKIQTAITEGYQAIAVNAGPDAKQVYPALESAIAKHIKVLAFDEPLPNLPGLSTTFGWGSARAGTLIGQYFKKELPHGGQIGIVGCFVGTNPILDGEDTAFTKTIKGSGIQVVNTVDGQCEIGTSRSVASNVITAHPKLKGFYSTTDPGIQGAQLAVQNSSLASSDPLLTGAASTCPILENMVSKGKKDRFSADTTFPFETFGEKAVSEAVQLAEGHSAPATQTIQPTLVTPANAASVLAGIEKINGGKCP